jgi:hypothetical protein
LVEILWWLLLGHFVADYPLQPDFVAKFKARAASLAAVPWYYVMTGHAATHAVAVGVVTGSPLLSLLEFAAHWLIDAAKCEGKTGIHTDQALHVACKVAWTGLLLCGIR